MPDRDPPSEKNGNMGPTMMVSDANLSLLLCLIGMLVTPAGPAPPPGVRARCSRPLGTMRSPHTNRKRSPHSMGFH